MNLAARFTLPDPDARDITILMLIRDGESYGFMYEDGQEHEVYRRLARWAGDPQLSFTWREAAVLSRRVREGL